VKIDTSGGSFTANLWLSDGMANMAPGRGRIPDQAAGMVRRGGGALPDLQIPRHDVLKKFVIIHCTRKPSCITWQTINMSLH